MGGIESVVILETYWIDCYQVDIKRSDNIIEVQINDKKAKIGGHLKRSNHVKSHVIVRMIVIGLIILYSKFNKIIRFNI